MVRSFTINSSFIIMHPHHNFSVNNATFQLFPIKITKIVKFWIFWKKKQSSEFTSSTFERRYFEEKFTFTSLYLNIINILCMFFTFQHVISSLSSASRKFIGAIFPLHTHIPTHTQINTLVSFIMVLNFACQQIYTIFSSSIH